MIRAVLVLLAGVSVSVGLRAATVAEADFSRYTFILERQPFGVPPVAPTPEPVAVAPQNSFVTHVRLTLLEERNGRIMVGFIDKNQKDKSYTLAVGERADDYEVLEADVTDEVAKIRKGAEEQWLSMKAAGAASAPSRASGTGRAALTPPAPTPARMPFFSAPPGVSTNLDRRQSRYAAIRRAELERERQADEERLARSAAVATVADDDDEDDDVEIPVAPPPDDEEDEDDEDDGEVVVVIDMGDEEDEDADFIDDEDEDEAIREAEIQQHLQSYQKELIRQGLPALPIPLTAESDAELVKEGVLPPLPPATDDEDEDEEDE